MKILVISNFYPPVRAWGYTLWCSEVIQILRQRGHQVQILTSNYQALDHPRVEGISRRLYLENDLNYYSAKHFFTRWKHEELANHNIIQSEVAQFDPDLVFIWGMYGFSHQIPARCEKLLPNRVVYFISDHWPINPTFNQRYWSSPANSTVGRAVKPLFAKIAFEIQNSQGYPPQLEFSHAITVSEAVRQDLIRAGLPYDQHSTIHGGSDPDRYYSLRDPHLEQPKSPVKIRTLYAGFLGEHKGVHTIIEALALLKDYLKDGRLEFSLVGSGHPDYEKRLSDLINFHALGAWVKLYGRIEPQNMRNLLQQHDVLIFPSIYEEPLPRMVQEAMLAGLLVIGTTTGGTGEMLIDGETGMTFAAGDADSLARQILVTIEHPERITDLARQGQQHIRENFNLIGMADQIETNLVNVFNSNQRPLHTQ